MKYLVFVAYYLFCAFLLAGTAYIVFWKQQSGWWFLLALVFANLSPEFNSDNKNE